MVQLLVHESRGQRPSPHSEWTKSRGLDTSQYLSIRYTERLGDAEIVASVGSRGDSYENALAESFKG